MIDEFEVLDSDSDINDESHKKLLGAVSRMYKKRRVEKPARTEPWHNVSEYHVGAGDSEAVTSVRKVSVEALAKNLPHNLSVLGDIHHTSDTSTLPLPVEKIYQDKVKRSVGYNNVKQEVAKWDPVITNARLSDQLTFPLAKPPPVSTFKPLQFFNTFSKPNELELKMAEALGESPVAQSDQQTEKVLFQLSLKEIIEKRKMLARIKAQESYKMSKQMKQNKIKSKSYRRLLRKEKQKEELKAFEELKKTDPEGALACLARMERSRVEERANLRHMNTGKWAKGKAIRAKYDRQARTELAEQLAKSRELRQKRAEPGSGSDEESEKGERERDGDEGEADLEAVDDASGDPNNPWMKTSDETVEGFVAGFKEFCARQATLNPPPTQPPTLSTNTPVRPASPSHPPASNPISLNATTSSSKNNSQPGKNLNLKSNSPEQIDTTNTTPENNSILLKRNPDLEQSANELVTAVEKSEDISPVNPDVCDISIKVGSRKLKRRKQKVVTQSGVWQVSDDSNNHVSKESMDDQASFRTSNGDMPASGVLEDLFHNAEYVFDQSIKHRLKNFTDEETKTGKKKITKERKKKEEETEKNPITEPDKTLPQQKDVVEKLAETVGLDKQNEGEVSKDIDPNVYMVVKHRYLTTQPVELNGAHIDSLDDPQSDQKSLRADLEQAFTDDGVLQEFTEEKEEETKKSQLANIEVGLPGWGSWAGSGINPSRSRKRLLLKAPTVKRKDRNMKKLILRDEIPEAVRKHQVSTLPFPFTSVKEYEASVRAPVGTTWLPWTAHQVLTKPPVVTKMGTVIQPMDSDQILMLKETQLTASH